MNKRDFLKRLESELSVLDPIERKEILDFYEERFHTGMIYENKTEAEVISDLEHPSVIAKNVLDEYGVPKKFVKKQEERYEGVKVSSVVAVILFDLFVVSWLIPTLFSVFIALFGTSFTWVASLPLILGEHNIVDQYVFAFATGAYILLFLFSLLVLEMLIWSVKKTIIWHLNVFKVNKREKFIKKSSSISVESFFKRHRGIKFIKNVMLIGGIVSLSVSGYWLLSHSQLVRENYTTEITTENYTHDFAEVLYDEDKWDLIVDVDTYDVQIKYTDDSELDITHKYYNKEKFDFVVDEDTHEIRINDTTNFETYNDVAWSLEDVFNQVFTGKQELIILLPSDLKVDQIDTDVSFGQVQVQNITVDDLDINSSLGSIFVKDTKINNLLKINVTTGHVEVIDTVSNTIDISGNTSSIEVNNVITTKLDINSNTGDINVLNSVVDTDIEVTVITGDVTLEELKALNYFIAVTTGSVEVEDLNVNDYSSIKLSVTVTTGSIDINDAYVDKVYLTTTTGSIDYHNELNGDFECSELQVETTTGSKDVTVSTK